MSKALSLGENRFFDTYILVAPGSDYGKAMWQDIERLDCGILLENVLRPCGRVVSFFHHFHFSFSINRKVQLPFQQIWQKFYALEQVNFESEKRYCVIFTDISAARTDLKYLKKLSRQRNITMVLMMVNTMARRGTLIEKRLPYFVHVFSFDQKDVEKYGFHYHPTNYSNVKLDTCEKITTDAFFVGVSKGRAETLAKIFVRFKEAGLKSDFYISGVSRHEKRIQGIHYNEWLSYASVLKHIQQCKCIVEVMDGNQQGLTLRAMEAVCYNKRLLTNNQAIKESKYYKSGNIQVFDCPEDIDPDFINCADPVDYKYEGEFSPVYLLKHINKIVEETEQ